MAHKKLGGGTVAVAAGLKCDLLVYQLNLIDHK